MDLRALAGMASSLPSLYATSTREAISRRQLSLGGLSLLPISPDVIGVAHERRSLRSRLRPMSPPA